MRTFQSFLRFAVFDLQVQTPSPGAANAAAAPSHEVLWPGLTPEDLSALSAAAGVASSLKDKEWMLRFGCALITLPLSPLDGQTDASNDILPQLSELSLHLICLDPWEFNIHR